MITLILIGLVGGLITGISPCVLPVLPVIFLTGGVRKAGSASSSAGTKAGATPDQRRPPARPAQPTRPAARTRRPYLIVAGLAVSFSIFTLLGTLILSALPLPKDTIRWGGLVLLVLLGIAMIFPAVQDLLDRPFARIGQRQVHGDRGGFGLGLALGAVYVPCAGPVLAAITVAGATDRIGLRTVALTVAFAVGTALPLLAFALAGQAVAERVRAFRDRQRGVRIVAGVVIIGLAVALTFNLTDVLQRSVPDYTASLNNSLNHAGAQKALALGPAEPIQGCAEEPAEVLQNCGKMPQISGIAKWLNTPGDAPVTAAALKGKVVLVDFWAYSCINCQRAIPHVEAWYSNYRSDGLVVIGVHTPEYAFEHVAGNVAAGTKRLHISYPVALDNDYTTWNHFANESWPADYLVDSNGQVRHAAIGEGGYGQTEKLIRQLLSAAHPGVVLPKATDLPDDTPQNTEQTPETYLGAERADTCANSPTGKLNTGTQTFGYPRTLGQNEFAFTGTWTIAKQPVTAGAKAGLELNFDASDVYLDVGGTGTVKATIDGRTTTYHVSGAPDIYTVAHYASPRQGRVTLSFSPGLQAYSFTFG